MGCELGSQERFCRCWSPVPAPTTSAASVLAGSTSRDEVGGCHGRRPSRMASTRSQSSWPRLACLQPYGGFPHGPGGVARVPSSAALPSRLPGPGLSGPRVVRAASRALVRGRVWGPGGARGLQEAGDSGGGGRSDTGSAGLKTPGNGSDSVAAGASI